MSYDKLVIVLAVAAGVPFLLALVPRVPLPGPVIEIVAGVVLGPAVLNVVQPDATVQALSIIGLSFLLFLAGLEIDFKPLRGPRARLVGIGLAGTLALAAAIGWVLHIAGLFESPLLLGTALVATSLGLLLVPILEGAGAGEAYEQVRAAEVVGAPAWVEERGPDQADAARVRNTPASAGRTSTPTLRPADRRRRRSSDACRAGPAVSGLRGEEDRAVVVDREPRLPPP